MYSLLSMTKPLFYFRNLAVNEQVPLTFTKAARLQELLGLMVAPMSVKAEIGRVGDSEEDIITNTTVGRASNFPVRHEWLSFLAVACDKLFHPYMPNRSGLF